MKPPRKKSQVHLALMLLATGEKLTRVKLANYGVAQPYSVIHQLRGRYGICIITTKRTDGVGRHYAEWSLDPFDFRYARDLVGVA